MHDQIKHSLHRWCSVFGTGLLAAALWILFERAIQTALSPVASLLGAIDFYLLSICLAIIILAIFLVFGRDRWGGFFGFHNFAKYPPTWVAVAFCGALIALAKEEWLLLLSAVGVIIAASVSNLAFLWFKRGPNATSSNAEQQTVDAATIPVEFEELVGWIHNHDRPISDPKRDLFGHDTIARRIADRLSAPSSPTIAVVGGLGTGKSSILELVRHAFKTRGILDQHISLVSLSLWGYDSVDAAVRGILGALIEELGRHVNTLSLSGLPDQYVRTIEKSGGLFGTLTHLLSGTTEPKTILEQLETITIAIDLRIVLWIEDLERFSGTAHLSGVPSLDSEADRVAAIRPLLYLLDRCEGITVVIADGSLESRFDIGKIARFVERIPKLSTKNVLDVIDTFRKGCLQGSGHVFIDSASSEIRKKLSFSELSPSQTFLTYRTPPDEPRLPEALAILIQTPRVLKSVLRVCHEIWSVLRGEIDFDDVLIMSILRESRPAVFSLIEAEIDAFRDGCGHDGATPETESATKHPVLKKLSALVAGEDDVTRNAVLTSIEAVFPHYQSKSPKLKMDRSYIDKPQGINHQRWDKYDVTVDYWLRYLTLPRIADEDSDQRALQAIDAWQDRSNPTELLNRILIPVKSAQIGAFARRFFQDNLGRLLVEVSERYAHATSGEWPEGHAPHGLYEAWIMMRAAHLPNDSVVDAVSRAFQKCLPVSLPVISELVLLFIDPNSDGATQSQPLLIAEDQKILRSRLIEDLLRTFPSGSERKLLRAMNRSSPFCLAYICLGLDRYRAGAYRPDEEQSLPFEKWHEFAPVLIEAAKLDPQKMLPQIAPLITSCFKISWERDEAVIRPVYDREYSHTAAELWFGSLLPELLKLFAETEIPKSLSLSEHELCEAVKTAARTFVGGNSVLES